MGRRGPPQTPTKLKLLRGESRPARINRKEPQPRANRPKMPRGLGQRAAQVWREVMRDFAHTGVLTAVDAPTLRAYCEAVARYEQAAQLLEESGPVVRGARRGDLVRNPLHQVMRDNADLMRQMARELGLTPSARTGLQVGDKGDADPFEAWQAGKEATP